jgi:hypothetical protein
MYDQASVVFNSIVIFTAIAQAYNYRMLGKHREISRYLNLFICSGFLITEAWIAVQPATPWGYWCYVALSVWGLYNFMGQEPE